MQIHAASEAEKYSYLVRKTAKYYCFLVSYYDRFFWVSFSCRQSQNPDGFMDFGYCSKSEACVGYMGDIHAFMSERELIAWIHEDAKPKTVPAQNI